MTRKPTYEELEQRIKELEKEAVERKRVEERLEEREQTLRALLNAPTETAILVDLEGTILALNEIAAQRIGKNADELVGLGIFDYLPPDMAVSRKTKGDEVTRSGKPVCFQDERAGRIYDNNIYPVFDAEGKVKALAIYARDITETKQDEEVLRESEERFRYLSESSPLGVFQTDKDGRVLYLNNKWLAITGMTLQDALGFGWAQALHPEDRPRILAEWASCLEEKRGYDAEFRFVRPSGEVRWVHTRTSPVFSPVGNIISNVGVNEDITERKQAEEALRESENKYRTLIENAGEAIIVAQDGVIKFANHRGEELYGRSQEELASRPLTYFIHEEDREMVGERHKRRLKGEEPPIAYSFRIVDKNGNIKWVELNVVLFSWDDRPATLCFMTNITDRKRAEEALQESEKRLSKINRCFLNFGTEPLENINLLTMLCGELMGAACALYNRLEEGMLCSWGQWNTPPDYNPVDKPDGHICYDVIKSAGDEISVVSNLQNTNYAQTDPNVIPYKLQTYMGLTVKLRDANVGSLCVVFQDDFVPSEADKSVMEIIASAIGVEEERKRAEETLRESEEKLARSKKMEAMGLLAGGVAHDLNNVLSGIVSYPELLLLDLPEDSPLRKPIETIQESGHRAAAIVQDLLTVARGVATTKEPLILNELVSDYLNSPEFRKLEQFRPTVTVKTNLDNDLFNVSGSHVHIRKVVMNLVSNASEAMEGKGNITISTMNRYIDRPLRGYDDVSIGEYVVLSVSDDGSGISSDDLERIFEPFYTKKVMGRSGTGLGLAVVWNVVQDHKGYIDVTTDENGTTFELYFPITRDEISDKALSIPIEDYKGDGETILVVDDVESQRDISCKMLDTLGYKTKAVSSGEEAVEYLKENTVDLILLDMIMDPGINGRETYERVIKINPNQKAIIISGFAETDEVKAVQKLGAGKYIKKPVTLEKIGLAIKEELEK